MVVSEKFQTAIFDKKGPCWTRRFWPKVTRRFWPSLGFKKGHLGSEPTRQLLFGSKEPNTILPPVFREKMRRKRKIGPELAL